MSILRISISAALLTVILANLVQAQIPQVAEIDRMVEERKKKVEATNEARIGRAPAMQPLVVQPPLRTGTPLLTRDTLRLVSDIWMELDLDNARARGNVVVASAGQYQVDSLDVAHPLVFAFRQGRMSVNLASGRLGVLLKNKLTSIFGTEVLFVSDPVTDMSTIYLKEGHVAIRDNDSLVVDVVGENLAWSWFGEGPMQAVAAAQMSSLSEAFKYDTKTVWPQPFYQKAWFWAGAAVVAGTVTCAALECGPFGGEDDLYDLNVVVDFPQ